MAYKLMLRPLRTEKGLGQRKVAAQIGVNPSAVAQWELGTAIPRTENLLALASLFDCTLDTLCGREAPGTA